MRKYYLISILFLSLTSQIFPQQQTEIPWPTLADSPWPMMSHDPQGTGRSPYIGPKTPNVIWTMDMPYGILSGPAIGEDGTIYFGTNSWLPGDTTNYFYAANPNGTLKWTFYTGETSATNPGFLVGFDSTIYFGSQSGNLYAVDYNGDLKWNYFAGTSIFQYIMNIDLEGNLYFPSFDGYLHSVDNNGVLNWKVNFNGGFYGESIVLAPDGNTLFVGGRDSNFYALNLDSSMKWMYTCKKVWSVPLVDNSGNIYITPRGYPAEVHCIMPNGNLKWKYSLTQYGDSGWWSGMTMDSNGNIYFTHGVLPNANSAITSLDYYGNYRWTYIFNDPFDNISTPLICDSEGTIYCGSTFGYNYYAISSEGQLLWKLPLDGYGVDNSGAINSDGTLYIGTHLTSTTIGQERTLIAVRDTGSVYVDECPFFLEYSLSQNYPNPFNPKTTINYEIPELSFVILKIYGVLGNEIATLINEVKPAGSYEIEYNATNLPSGTYFYQLQAGSFVETKKMVLMK